MFYLELFFFICEDGRIEAFFSCENKDFFLEFFSKTAEEIRDYKISLLLHMKHNIWNV